MRILSAFIGLITVCSAQFVIPNGFEFTCQDKEDGRYAKTCSQIFYSCSNGILSQYTCGEGLVYNALGDACDFPGDECRQNTENFVQTSTISSETVNTWNHGTFDCSSLDDGFYSNGCTSSYTSCLNGFGSNFHCPVGTLFDAARKVCTSDFLCGKNKDELAKESVSADVVNQENESISRDGISFEFDCSNREDGTYGVGCLDHFFSCVGGISYRRYCPAGLVFFENTTSCEHSCDPDDDSVEASGSLQSNGFSSLSSFNGFSSHSSSSGNGQSASLMQNNDLNTHVQSGASSSTGRLLNGESDSLFLSNGVSGSSSVGSSSVGSSSVGSSSVGSSSVGSSSVGSSSAGSSSAGSSTVGHETTQVHTSSVLTHTTEIMNHGQTGESGSFNQAGSGVQLSGASNVLSDSSNVDASDIVQLENDISSHGSSSSHLSSSTVQQVADNNGGFSIIGAVPITEDTSKGTTDVPFTSSTVASPTRSVPERVQATADPIKKTLVAETVSQQITGSQNSQMDSCFSGETRAFGACSSKFNRCLNNVWTVARCPGMTVFDESIGLCIYDLPRCKTSVFTKVVKVQTIVQQPLIGNSIPVGAGSSYNGINFGPAQMFQPPTEAPYAASFIPYKMRFHPKFQTSSGMPVNNPFYSLRRDDPSASQANKYASGVRNMFSTGPALNGYAPLHTYASPNAWFKGVNSYGPVGYGTKLSGRMASDIAANNGKISYGKKSVVISGPGQIVNDVFAGFENPYVPISNQAFVFPQITPKIRKTKKTKTTTEASTTAAPSTTTSAVVEEMIEGSGMEEAPVRRHKRSYDINAAPVEKLCAAQPIGSLVALGNCRQDFVYCDDASKEVVAACPIGELFDESIKRCLATDVCGVYSSQTVSTITEESEGAFESPTEPSISEDLLTATAQGSVKSSMCKGNIRFAGLGCHPQFIDCENGETVLSCGSGHVFNQEKQHCDDDVNVIACQAVVAKRKEESALIEQSTKTMVTESVITEKVVKKNFCRDLDGFFAVANCSEKYVSCREGVELGSFTCGSGYVFFEEQKSCIPKEESRCGVPKPYVPVFPIPARDQPKKKDCSAGAYSDAQCSRTYKLCKEGENFELFCPEGLIFDQKSKTCDYPQFIEGCKHLTSEFKASESVVTIAKEVSQKSQFPDPVSACKGKKDRETIPFGECRDSFMRCINQATIIENCPNGHVFSEKHGKCVKRFRLQECSENVEYITVSNNRSDFCKGRRDGLYRDPSDCSGIFQCFNSDLYVRPGCTSGLVFNEQSNQCDYSHTVAGCEIKAEDSKVQVGCRGAMHGQFLADENDCSIFYRCVWNRLETRNCPSGTVFNPTLSICDWLVNVPQCSGTVNVRTTTEEPETEQTTADSN